MNFHILFILPPLLLGGEGFTRDVLSNYHYERFWIDRCCRTKEELQTIPCETELVINNRPLAYQSNDDTLTPWHLLHGRNIKNLNNNNLPASLF